MSIYPRVNYEMTKEDLELILDACKPTPIMKIGGSTGPSPQENANRAWQTLGKKMGFDYMTVRPSGGYGGKGERFFSAVPTELEEQREERLKKEAEKKRLSKIETLTTEIAAKQEEREQLMKGK